MKGRFAPSPTGVLHLGNLRTALLAWLFAQSAGSSFVVRVEDLDVRRAAPHPVWDGVAVEDLTSRRGVVGFYARGWHAPPEGARILHTIGPAELPVDFVYRVGAGRVLFHGGNDLWTFAANTSTRRLTPQLLAWAI